MTWSMQKEYPDMRFHCLYNKLFYSKEMLACAPLASLVTL